ncbi:MAG: LamG domain-containing protein, partial [Candidatus Vogelbacteria bacterium]|nr:LamG domain-containing protein [Candidatus Vogelbacteria bacterium]
MHKLYPHERFFILALLITAISGGAWFYEPLQEYLTGLLARAAGVISNTPKSPASAQSSLVGHWTFDGPDVNWRTGVVSDKAGTNNGQMRGTMSTSTSPVAGVHGQGLKFDGVDDSIDVSSVAGGTAFTATDNFTLTAWIRPSALPSAGANIVGRNTNSNGNWFLRTEGNNLRGGVQDVSGNGAVRTGTTVLIIDRWYFATMVYTGSTKTTALFLDAVSEGTAVNASLSGNLYNTNNVSIGKRDEGAGDLFSPSSLDDVRIYNRALTADEITALYRAGSSAKLSVTPKSPASAQSSLVGHWTFDGPDVNWRTGVVSDKAGTNNGQMQGTMSTSTAPVVGVHGQGLAFDGSDDNIKLDANISNFSGLARGTVSMWFN